MADFSERLIACKSFRWDLPWCLEPLNERVYRRNWCPSISTNGFVQIAGLRVGPEPHWRLHEARIDMECPANLGCIRHLVREEWGPTAHVRCREPASPDMSGNNGPWYVVCDGQGRTVAPWAGRHHLSEVEALIAVLEPV